MANTYQGACGRVPSVRPGANFKEAVCIDTNRVYDSVSDKNCLEDLQVTFPDDVQSIVNNCCSLKLKEVEVENVYMDVEPIPFNQGLLYRRHHLLLPGYLRGSDAGYVLCDHHRCHHLHPQDDPVRQ